MRLSIDCKATVKIGEYSRGGQTRGDPKAADHDMGCEEKHTPFGVVNEDSGQLHLSFGSSAKTSDFLVDSLYAWWKCQSPEEQARVTDLQIKTDIPCAVTIESSGRFGSSGSIGTVAPWRGWCGYLASSVRWPS